jgi:hypothetical protein
MVSAAYDSGQELDLTSFSDLPANMGDLIQFPALSITVDKVYRVPISENTSHDFQVLVVDVTIRGGEVDVPLSAYQWFLDSDESRYSPDLSLSTGTTYRNLPAMLSAGEHIQASVSFLGDHFEDDVLLLLMPPQGTTKQIRIPFHSPTIPISVETLDVQLKRIWRDNSHVFVDVRIYNPQAEPIRLELEHIGFILGFTAHPVGPIHRPLNFEPLIFEPELSLDITLTFDWNADDPFASLTLAGRVWAMTLVK